MACPPRYITPVSEEDMLRGDGALVQQFQESFCRITKDGFAGHAGELIRFRPWQTTLTSKIYARRPDGKRKHRRALVGLPRKNGKSAINSGFGIHGLITGGQGAEVYACAADKDQAKIVFGVAKTMVEADEDLSQLIKPYRDVLEVPTSGSIFRALSSEAFTKEGLNPTLVIYDELHAAPTDELYDVMLNAFGARKDPMLIAITTAGVKSDQTGGDSICYRLYNHGIDICDGTTDDPSFFFAWWGSPENADPSKVESYENSNPGYGDLLDPEDFAAVYKTHVAKGTVNDFKTKRMNMWVSAVKAWMPDNAWSACYHDFEFVPPKKGVVLGFDGSMNGDSTALLACTVEPDPKLIVVKVWEKPIDKQEAIGWSVPRPEVMEEIRKCCRMWNVREVAADEYIWVGELETLAEEGIPVVTFPQTMTRMGPATQRFFELVTNKRLWHDGNAILARHIGNAKIKTDLRGSRLIKDAPNSPRKIDAAVGAVMAVDRAGFWLTQDAPDTFQGVPVKDIHFVW